MMFRRLLVANRGEIAVRIFRTARRLGIECIAVYSDADRDAMHVRHADRSFRLGPAPAAESYLHLDRMLASVSATKADAVHPGYGFLAENPLFADRLKDSGVTFVGPPSSAMRAVGDKREARRRMDEAGIPVIPGAEDANADSDIAAAARRLGYPVMIKAAAGGGGLGMRRVGRESELSDATAACRREARAAFGDDRLLLERSIEPARHVEVQVFADSHGNAVHMFERDCSMQRRHQKILEEAPAPGLAPRIAESMREAALRATRAAGYQGAGTVEFLVPAENAGPDSFYFMEMNARLQVEHPVTEAITGEDLVEWQLRIAAGESLPKAQSEIRISGHAIEARFCAEDPAAGFRPSPGRIRRLRMPVTGTGLRIDSGVEEGDTIPRDYDSMVAKVIACAPDRSSAINRLRKELESIRVSGPVTNQAFLLALTECASFRAAGFDTGLVAREMDSIVADMLNPPPEAFAASALHTHLARSEQRGEDRRGSLDPYSPFGGSNGWRFGGEAPRFMRTRCGNRVREISITGSAGQWLLSVAGEETEPQQLSAGAVKGESIVFGSGPDRARVRVFNSGGAFVDVYFRRACWRVEHLEEDDAAGDSGSFPSDFRAPLPGIILRYHVTKGEHVACGSPLVTIEAMKTEHTIRAPADGKVTAIHGSAGSLVEEGDELLAVEVDELAGTP